MVKALGCQVKGPGFESHHGKKFGKIFGGKKLPAVLCLHDGSPDDGCAPQLVKEHVWTIGTCPTNILLSDLSCIICM